MKVQIKSPEVISTKIADLRRKIMASIDTRNPLEWLL